MVTIRNSDGTAFYGSISYNNWSVRENNLKIKLNQKDIPSLENIYKFYENLSLDIDFKNLYESEIMNIVYDFLYGCSLDDLMEFSGNEGRSRARTFIRDPKEWTKEMVETMDWNSFCLTYYMFLYSDNDFKSNAWSVLNFIFKALNKNPNILSLILMNSQQDFNSKSCSEFWNIVYGTLTTKVLSFLHDDTCYVAFYSMLSMRHLFNTEAYKYLEYECCSFLNEIAIERAENAHDNEYTIDELSRFNKEFLFFYDDYFSSVSFAEEAEEKVRKIFFDFFHNMGNVIADSGHMIVADELYEKALKNAKVASEMVIILNKRKKISLRVLIERICGKFRDLIWKFKVNIAEIIGSILLISFFLTILFGIFTLFGLFKAFSKIVFQVSLVIVISIFVILFIDWIKSRKRRK